MDTRPADGAALDVDSENNGGNGDARRAGAGTVGDRIRRELRRSGAGAVYGDRGTALPVTAATPPELAPLLVAAHERVHRERAASWRGGLLEIGTTNGEPFPLHDLSLLPVALGCLRAGGAVEVDVDLDAPAPQGEPVLPDARSGEPDDLGSIAARIVAARAPVILAGPGVVAARAVPGLHALATAARVGVLNTWGAKGVFPWQSRHHWATIGLQRDDFRLAGLADADLIVAVGLDEDESPAERWQLAAHVVVDPHRLGALAEICHRDAALPPMPRLRDLLAAATQRGWPVETAPLPPSRVTRTYGVLAAEGALIAADPGTAGYWVARTVGTTVLDSVIVPAGTERPGFAVACALVARIARPLRPVLAVTDGPPETSVTDLATALGLPVPVEVWTDDGPRLDAAAHGSRLLDAVHGDGPAVVTLATDPAWLPEMLEVAGPIVAW